MHASIEKFLIVCAMLAPISRRSIDLSRQSKQRQRFVTLAAIVFAENFTPSPTIKEIKDFHARPRYIKCICLWLERI